MQRVMIHGASERIALILMVAAGVFLGPPRVAQGDGATWKASVATGGEPSFCGDPTIFCYSITAAISADGRYVSFSSRSTNLVPGPHNGSAQIYLHDRLTCTTIRVSETPQGGPANFSSDTSALSADGRYLAYDSTATNILPGVNNGMRQMYLYDRDTGITELISASPSGQPGNGASAQPTLSADGRYLSFQSEASNLVDGDTNGLIDIFVHDRQTGLTRRVNVTDAGEQAESAGGITGGHSRRPRMSTDGRFVVYDSGAGNLSDLFTGDFQAYLHDRDSNNTGVFDEAGGISTVMVSVSSTGEPANDHATWPTVTDDGLLVAFVSGADNLGPGITNNTLDIFVHDLQTGQTTRESVGPGGQQGSFVSFFPLLTPDGRYLTFHDSSPQLLGGGFPLGFHQVLRRELKLSENVVLSVNNNGVIGNHTSEFAVVTPNGQIAAFSSVASNLVPNHPHTWADVYVRSTRAADINNDGSVGVSDLLALLSAWGPNCGSADLNGDGVVGVADLLLLLADWG